MGQVSTEQTVAIIDSIGEALNNAHPTMTAEPNMNYLWLLSLGVIPVLLGWWLNKKSKKGNKHGK